MTLRKFNAAVRMADIGLPPRAHAKVLNPDKHVGVYIGPGACAEAVALEEAHALFFDQELGGVAAVLRDFVPVAT